MSKPGHTSTVQRYLKRWAEPRARQFQPLTDHYRQAVVVPVYDEAEDCLGRVFQHLEQSSTLIIAVVNTPDDAGASQRARTLHLLEHIAHATALDVLIVDCASQPLPRRSAVGVARKTGTDIALALHAAGCVSSPWLYQTDADAVLPADYFDALPTAAGAVVFGHRHSSEDARLQTAARLYEQHMAWYVAGLTAAGSQYAYPTLGSTITIHAHTYAAVRGYPRRNAAEDFYLLNKAAKVHGVRHLPHIEVQLQARTSERVPFGTGPALREIVAGLQRDPTGLFYRSYHPQTFRLLAQALRWLDAFAIAPTQPCAHELSELDTVTDILSMLRFDRVRDAITRQYPDPMLRRRAVHEWFDAGKTLRFIHLARYTYPDQPLSQICDQPLISH